MQHLVIGNRTVDPALIGYVDLNYRAPGGSPRVVVALAENDAQRALQNFQRHYFADREAEMVKRFFMRPENHNPNFVVFSN